MSALLLPNEILSMSAQAARLLVESGDGDSALLYLALLECGGDFARAVPRLRWGEERLGPAWARLSALGLAQPRGENAPPPATAEDGRLPEYGRAEIAAAMEQEPDFQGLCREMEGRLGRVFSDSDLRCLYTMYDYLALPPEVILLLTGWAARRERRQKGGPAVPRMPQLQKEAFRWKRLGVDTLDRAEDYLRREELVDRREWEILSAAGVTERRAAVGRERAYIAAWVDMGLSVELIRMAYERTVYKKGTMNWPYANKILQSWHAAGFKTPQQVEAGDRPPSRQAQSFKKQPRDFQPTRERIEKNGDWLDKFLEEQKKGGG